MNNYSFTLNLPKGTVLEQADNPYLFFKSFALFLKKRFDYVVYVVHDKDKDENNNYKRIHAHYIVSRNVSLFTKNYTKKQYLEDLFLEINEEYCYNFDNLDFLGFDIVKNNHKMHRYLLHLDTPSKHLYHLESIVSSDINETLFWLFCGDVNKNLIKDLNILKITFSQCLECGLFSLSSLRLLKNYFYNGKVSYECFKVCKDLFVNCCEDAYNYDSESLDKNYRYQVFDKILNDCMEQNKITYIKYFINLYYNNNKDFAYSMFGKYHICRSFLTENFIKEL